jgi:hypothetical protein
MIVRRVQVTWLFSEDDFRDARSDSVAVTPTRTTAPSTSLDVLNLLEEDEEELDFDIINIDTNLLRVPKILTYESLGKGSV